VFLNVLAFVDERLKIRPRGIGRRGPTRRPAADDDDFFWHLGLLVIGYWLLVIGLSVIGYPCKRLAVRPTAHGVASD
jgi:hypothetical protein